MGLRWNYLSRSDKTFYLQLSLTNIWLWPHFIVRIDLLTYMCFYSSSTTGFAPSKLTLRFKPNLMRAGEETATLASFNQQIIVDGV